MERRRRNDLPVDAPVRVGQVLAGKYRVERMIGRGGMGLVVAARHLHLGEQVAIKLLLPGVRVRPTAYERFLREGRAAARMRSEHVARVHDAGVLETGQPYLVLEYLEGVDLRTLLRKQGRLPVDTAVVYLLQVCEGLAEAHALGIVHRDLKPGNLFRTRRADGSDAVKVIDFGISKVMSAPADGGGDTPLTEQEGAIGTPAYMAPEQMRSARAADARADIWSLGAVLHGLLTGSPPFAGETMVAVYDGILKGPPSLRAARPDVPPELEQVVLRCLRVDPAERYEDVGQLAAALAELAPAGARLHAERAVRITQGRPIADPAAGQGPGEDGPGAATTTGGSMPEALQDTSLAGEGASTEITRDPSWVQGPARPRDDGPAAAPEPPSGGSGGAAPPRDVAPSRRHGASRRLSIAIAVALAIGGGAVWLARRVAPGEAPRPSPIASSSADRREEEAHVPPPIASPGLVASVTPPGSAPVASSPPAPLRHPQDPMERRAGSRRAAPPPPRAPATVAPAATTAPRVPGLAETPD